MHTTTTDSTPALDSETRAPSPLVTVQTLATRHPDACPVGGTRYALFHFGKELEDAGILIRFGRKILIDEPRYIEWLRSGAARDIRRKVQPPTRQTPHKGRHDRAPSWTHGAHPAAGRNKTAGGRHD